MSDLDPASEPLPPTEDETMMTRSGTGASLNAEQELPEGTKLGKYLIRRLIGRGGMGLVYLALDTLLRREVALKVLPTAFTQDQQALKRFVREAQLAARLNHPNAVTVFDIARKKGLYFIAMELVEGQSAQELVAASGAVGHERATQLIADACRALAAAHKAGLIHRDIKPANILVGSDGMTKLSDFGLAKLHEAEANNVTLTQQDAVIGTPKYMSPEQCQNQPLDARTDLYSLGATYYALITGNAPYDTGTTMQILFAHCSQPVPDPSQSVQGLPAGCIRVIQKSMAKDPNQRYASAADMLEDLERVVSNQPVAVPIEDLPDEPDEAALQASNTLSALAQASDSDAEPVPLEFPVAQVMRRNKKTSALPMPLLLGGLGGAALVGLIVLLVILFTGDGDTDTDQPDLAIDLSGSTPAHNTQSAGIATSDRSSENTSEAETTSPSIEPEQVVSVIDNQPEEPAPPVDPVPTEETKSAPDEVTPAPAPEPVEPDETADAPDLPAPPLPTPTEPAPEEPKVDLAKLRDHQKTYRSLKRDLEAAIRNRDVRKIHQTIQKTNTLVEELLQSEFQEFRDLGDEVQTFLDETKEKMDRNKPDENRPDRRPERPKR